MTMVCDLSNVLYAHTCWNKILAATGEMQGMYPVCSVSLKLLISKAVFMLQ